MSEESIASTPAKLPPELEAFMKNNTGSSVRIDDGKFHVEKPWGEKGFEFVLEGLDDAALTSFATIRLPSRFSAIRHLDSGDIEFIAGYFMSGHRILGRSFVADFCGNSYKCEFANASAQLSSIEKKWKPIGASETNYRNLLGLRAGRSADAILTSFWIRKAPASDNDLIHFAKHLNFYMEYYDRRTPRIIIHENEIIDTPSTLNLFPHGLFPTHFTVSEIPGYLLSVWDSTHAGSPFQQYIHWYQILEYVAFYYTSEDTLSHLRRALRLPGALSDVEALSQKVRDIMVLEKGDDEDKFAIMFLRAVDPKVLWSEIQKEQDFFSSPSVFEGDLTIDAIITKSTDFKEFEKNWNKTLASSFRNIRNGLVHARHKYQAHTLHPTTENERKLAPWLNLISLTATQQIVFKSK